MGEKQRAYFDSETIALLRESLEDAWARLPPEQQKNISRCLLGERILKAAASGERDREELITAALGDTTGG